MHSWEERLRQFLISNRKLCEYGHSRLHDYFDVWRGRIRKLRRSSFRLFYPDEFVHPPPPSVFPLYTSSNYLQTTSSARWVYSIKQGEKWQSRNDRRSLLKTKSDHGGEQNRTEQNGTFSCMISRNGELDWGSVGCFVCCGASNYQTSGLLQAQFPNLFFSLSLQRFHFGPWWGFSREGARSTMPL